MYQQASFDLAAYCVEDGAMGVIPMDVKLPIYLGATYNNMANKIIMPNDIDKILIQPRWDMLTLLTCRPYASRGRYRYVVYCDRVTIVV